MKPGERRVSARRGWAGEKDGILRRSPLVGVAYAASVDELEKLQPGLRLTAEGA
jgi:hypothetical protein